MKLSVVTIAAGRHEHLTRQLDGLRAGDLPSEHVVVAMGDPHITAVCADSPARVLELPTIGRRLPLAAARNLGARAALTSGADALVFLDVDCIPVPDLLSRYHAALTIRPDALLSGPVTYLPEGADVSALQQMTSPHPARPNPTDGHLQPMAHALFWSLSFACTAATWRRLGGFCEQYVGYGGEDTDLGETARERGIEHLAVGGAHAYHQWHPTDDPPVGHLADILRNGRLFADRWGWWPMRGWFEQFAELGLVTADGRGGYRDSA